VPVTMVTLEEPAFARRWGTSTPTGRRWNPRRLIGAALGGVLMGMAFPPMGWWWAAPAGVALLVLSVSGARLKLRQAAVLGAWSGSAFALSTVNWLSTVAPEALIGVVAYFAVWWALMLVGMSLVLRHRRGLMLIPWVWVLVEWLRSLFPFGGFPWARLGFAAVEGPWQWLIPYLGVYGLSFVQALLGACLAGVLITGARQPRAAVAAVGGVTLALAIPGPWLDATRSSDRRDDSPNDIAVAVIQGGPQMPAASRSQRRTVLEAHARVTRDMAALSAEPLDLVIWPENATDIDPLEDDWARRTVDAAVDAVAAPVVVGALTEAPDGTGRRLNQAILWRPGSGPGPTYTKSRLVPFGEYVPLRSVLAPVVPSRGRLPRDLLAVEGPPTLDVGPVDAGVLLCYEVAFDDKVQEAVRGGAGLLLVPSNNATYTGSSQPLQQLAIERFRAVETARAVLVASTTGVSAIISPDGEIVASLADGSSGWLSGRVGIGEGLTPAVRFGATIGLVLAAGGAWAILLSLLASPVAVPMTRTRGRDCHSWSLAQHRLEDAQQSRPVDLA